MLSDVALLSGHFQANKKPETQMRSGLHAALLSAYVISDCSPALASLRTFDPEEIRMTGGLWFSYRVQVVAACMPGGLGLPGSLPANCSRGLDRKRESIHGVERL